MYEFEGVMAYLIFFYLQAGLKYEFEGVMAYLIFFYLQAGLKIEVRTRGCNGLSYFFLSTGWIKDWCTNSRV